MSDKSKLDQHTAQLLALIATSLSLVLLVLFRLQSGFAPLNDIHQTGRMDREIIFSTLLAIVGFAFSFSFWPQLWRCIGMIVAAAAVLYLNISVVWYAFQ